MAHVSSHFLRHAYATISLAGDGSSKPSLISVSKSLGHAGLASTQVYLHSLDEKSPSEFISLVDPDEEDDSSSSSSSTTSASASAAASAKRKSQDTDLAAASAKPINPIKKRKTNPAKKNSRLLAFLRN